MIKRLTAPLMTSFLVFAPQLAYARQSVSSQKIYQFASQAGLTVVLPDDKRKMKGCATAPEYQYAGLSNGYVAIAMCPRFDQNGQVSLVGMEVFNDSSQSVNERRFGAAGFILRNYAIANGSSEADAQVLLNAIVSMVNEVIVQGNGKVEKTRHGYNRLLIYDFDDIKYRVVVIGTFITNNPGGFNGHNSTNITIKPLS